MTLRNFYIRYISGYREYFQTIKFYGVFGLLQDVKNRSGIWSIKEYTFLEGEMSVGASSITDEPNYLTVGTLAQKNEEVLSKFKSCHEYRLVLEHVSRTQGEKYLTHIHKNHRIIDNMKEIARTEIGAPFRYEYSELGSISPTQIRYAKILQDLERMFDFSQIRQVVEIGVGNGGQAAQICNLNQLENYTFVDLEPVLGLTQTLLSAHKFRTRFEFLNPNQIYLLSSDLFLSNYAFSELNKTYQDIYLENILENSKRGFMLYNHIHENPETGYTALEILDKIPGSALYAEDPLTFVGNVIVAWGFDTDRMSNYFVPVSTPQD